MNARFDFEIPQELRELTDSNIFYKYQIYFSCLTGVLIHLKERQKNVTQIDSSNQRTQTTIRSSLIQDLYLKFADESEEDITFIDSNIKARKDHFLTVIFVRYPGKSDKEFMAVYNHNLNKSFLDRNFYKERWSDFSHTFLKGQSLVNFTFWTIILSSILIFIFVFMSSFLKIDLVLIYILGAIALISIILLLFVHKINDTLMKQKIYARLHGILAFLKSQERDRARVKDTTEFEYIDEWN